MMHAGVHPRAGSPVTYVDIIVIPLPEKHLTQYRRMARSMGRIWREHGALAYRESLGEDLTPGMGAKTFPTVARTKPGETVVVSTISYKSRAHRDRVNAKVMSDPRVGKLMDGAQLFDMSRATFGGFDVIVDL